MAISFNPEVVLSDMEMKFATILQETETQLQDLNQ
jgi:hypothetical protein